MGGGQECRAGRNGAVEGWGVGGVVGPQGTLQVQFGLWNDGPRGLEGQIYESLYTKESGNMADSSYGFRIKKRRRDCLCGDIYVNGLITRGAGHFHVEPQGLEHDLNNVRDKSE